MNFLKKIIASCALAFGMTVGVSMAQQPQTQAAPIFATNAKYANGVAPGYAPCGVVNGLASSNCPSTTGLNIQIGPGTANCPAGTITTYAGGSFSLSPSTTTYIYLNTAANCTVSTKTAPFSSSDITIATVVTGSSGITSISDDRTFFSTAVGQIFTTNITPPIAGQFVAVYPSTFTFTANDSLSFGSVANNSGYSSSGGGPIGAPHTGTLSWSNYTLPSFVVPANVTAIYAVTINSTQGTDVTPTFSCSPTGSPMLNILGGQQQVTQQLSPTITGSNIGTVSCSASTAHSLSNGGYNAINVSYIALLVYYTGSAPPVNNDVAIIAPLFYNQSNNTFGITLPSDAAFDTGSANAYVVSLAGYAMPIPGIGSNPKQQVGTTIRFLAAHASTSTTPTLNFNNGGAITIVGPSGGALSSGDISTSEVAVVVLEPSGNWALQNPQVSGGSPVTSVSNSDSSLTISPTTGAVVASLNVGHANTWTANQTFNGGFDASAASNPVKMPVISSCATVANGQICYDSTNNNWHFWKNGADFIMVPLANGFTSGHCTNAVQTGGSWSLADAGGACGISGGGVTSFTGDGTFSNNSASTGSVTLSLANAGAHKWWGNNTGSTAAPGYQSIGAADLPSGIFSCTEVWSGSGTSSALTSGDDAISNNTCYNDSGSTRTITAVKCRSDNASNTTTVNPTFGSAGTGTTILSGALTCGSSYAYSSSGTVSNASWTTGTGIDPAMGGTLTGTSIAMIVEYHY